MKSKSKGQIFTLDVFLAVAFMVIVIGFMMWQMEEINSRGSAEYEKMMSMTYDWSQITVKTSTASNNAPNFLTASSLANVLPRMQEAFEDTPYSVVLIYKGSEIPVTTQNNCDSAQDVATSRRIVYDPITLGVEELSVKICV